MNNPYFYTEDLNAVYDAFELFKYYNQYFFQNALERCTIQWSKKMTLCAGVCEYKGCGSCSIRLSEPLLKYRTSNELKQTLIHQMIHAYLFITDPQACKINGGHGKEFQQIMKNINNITGLRITVYHSFNDEVQLYRTHVWRCNGICKQRPPYYGYVKRTMNRKPQPADPWFKDHQRYCDGQFIKISEPQKKTSLNKQIKNKNGKSIIDYLKQGPTKGQNQQKVIQNQQEFQEMHNKRQTQIVSKTIKQKINNNKIKKVQKKQIKNEFPIKKAKTIQQYIREMKEQQKEKKIKQKAQNKEKSNINLQAQTQDINFTD